MTHHQVEAEASNQEGETRVPYRPIDLSLYPDLSIHAKNFARLFNQEISYDQFSPKVEGLPLAVYLLEIVAPVINTDEYRILSTALPASARRTEMADETEDDPDYRDAAHMKTLDNGTGWSSQKIRATVLGGVSRPVPPTPHKKSHYHPSKVAEPANDYPPLGEVTDEIAQKWREFAAPLVDTVIENRAQALSKSARIPIEEARNKEQIRYQALQRAKRERRS